VGKMAGKLFIVGFGPGDKKHMTLRCLEAIEQSDVIVGYELYVDLIREMLENKEVYTTQMQEEIDRVKTAIQKALEGHAVSLVSSGDSGVYGMAGLVFEVLSEMRAQGLPVDIEVEVIPGVTAATAVAALLGAPLMHDFATISLSDLLTPWPVILKRIEAAAAADFVIVIYNPKSSRRVTQVVEARDVILKYRHKSTPVGIVRKAYREGQEVIVTDLEHMLNHKIDMLTTIVVGNSSTFVFNGRMVTPRGYSGKYELLKNDRVGEETIV
jgi:precorrin-3B C17-methyltransferase